MNPITNSRVKGALKQSIHQYKKYMADPDKYDFLRHKCPLCSVLEGEGNETTNECSLCVITAYTGDEHCTLTPYYKMLDMAESHEKRQASLNTRKYKHLCFEMIELLEKIYRIYFLEAKKDV